MAHASQLRFSTKDLMLTTSFSAIYVVYGYVSSVTVGGITHGVDVIFVGSALFVLLGAFTARFGAPTLMGAIAGALFAFAVPAPFSFSLIPACIMYGLTYDIYMQLTGYPTNVTKKPHVIIASTLSSAMMSLTVFSVLTLMGFFQVNVSALVFIWLAGILEGTIAGLAGGFLGLRIARYLHLKNYR